MDAPCSQEVVSVVGALPLIELDDAFHAILVAICFGDDRVWRKIDAIGSQYHMLRYVARGRQRLG